MNYASANTVVQSAGRNAFFSIKKPTLTRQEFVDQLIGCWWSGIGNYLTLETEKHQDKAELIYDLLYKQFREFVDSHNTTSSPLPESPRIGHLLIQGRLDDAIVAYNEWKSEILAAQIEMRGCHSKGTNISLLEEMEAKQLQIDSLKPLIREIEREQDRLASQGRVAEANVHRHEELSQARRQIQVLYSRITEIRQVVRRI